MTRDNFVLSLHLRFKRPKMLSSRKAQGQYSEFLLKVSTNFSLIFVSKQDTLAHKYTKRPLAKLTLAKGLLDIFLC